MLRHSNDIYEKDIRKCDAVEAREYLNYTPAGFSERMARGI